VSRFHSYLNSAKTILGRYKGDEPFSSFLKKYFAANKKFGSKDRKQVSHLCYCYFRLGKALKEIPAEERILAGLFLCWDEPNEILESLKPEWNQKIHMRLKEKCSLINAPHMDDSVGQECSMLNVFPWHDQLSNGMDHEKFSESFFIQPDLFLRLRPGNEHAVKGKLENAGISFEIVSDNCIALPNGSKVDDVIALNREAVVQDYNSQRTGQFLALVRRRPSDEGRSDQVSDRVWDCCAASGGKSIMLHDLYPQMNITVSDKRESIIVNLKKRFKEAGITNYKSFVADLTVPGFEFGVSSFDLIIYDAPCTGSGTWSRTPEQLYFFEEQRIDEYASLQKKILSKVIAYLKPAGFILYITCSVFKKENEEIVDFLQHQYQLRLVKMELLKGYDKKADTMFAALLCKTS